jgi:hypothetical protein
VACKLFYVVGHWVSDTIEIDVIVADAVHFYEFKHN